MPLAEERALVSARDDWSWSPLPPVLILLLLFPGVASATQVDLFGQTLRLDLSEYGIASYHVDNGNIAPAGSPTYDPTGSNYVDWLNRFQVDASWGDFTALLRFDSIVFFNAPQAAAGDSKIQQLLVDRFANRTPSSDTASVLGLEKVAAGYNGKYFEIILGDSYVTYGRGLVLALRKIDELAIDTTVRGVNATGKVAGFSLNAVAGYSNIINVDPATGREADDPHDIILGTRAEYRFGKYAVPGIDASHIIYATNSQDYFPQRHRDQVTSISETLELPWLGPYGTLYAEYAQQDKLIDDQNAYGDGFYGAATGYLGPATLLVEYKDYRNYQNIQTSLDPLAVPELALSDYYDAPPTLERLQQQVLNNTDVVGPHGRLDVAINASITPFVSMAYFQDRTYKSQIYDPYGGVELHWLEGRSRAAISGGERWNIYEATPRKPQTLFQRVWHVEYDVNQSITGPYSIELDGLHMTHHDQIEGTNYLDWMEGQAYLSFKRADLFSVAAGFEYYTEASASTRPYYFNGSGSWTVREGTLIRLFAGGQRAGIKCVNGVCRNYPAFDGVRVEVLTRF